MPEIKLCECGCGQPAPMAPETDTKRGWIKGQPKRFVVGHNARLQAGRIVLPNTSKLCACGCGQFTPVAKKTNTAEGYVKGQPKRYVNGHNPSRKCLRHGFVIGGKRRPEYRAFEGAKERCTNPNHGAWKDYGGRGIRFLFTSVEQFFAELGPRPSPKHSLDRINNDGNYEPGNCRWATKREQMLNRRPFRRRAVTRACPVDEATQNPRPTPATGHDAANCTA